MRTQSPPPLSSLSLLHPDIPFVLLLLYSRPWWLYHRYLNPRHSHPPPDSPIGSRGWHLLLPPYLLRPQTLPPIGRLLLDSWHLNGNKLWILSSGRLCPITHGHFANYLRGGGL